MPRMFPRIHRLHWLLLGLLVTGPALARVPIGKIRDDPRGLLLVAGGDVAYPRGWSDGTISRLGPKLFAEVAPFVRSSNLAFVNLESPLTDSAFKVKKRWPIATSPGRLDFILGAGFNLLSLANNHMSDAGLEGIRETLDVLGKRQKGAARGLGGAGAHIDRSGKWAPTRVTVKGKRLPVDFYAFGYAGSSNVPVPGGQAVEAVRKNWKPGRFTIVSVHHGVEYRHVPSAGKAALYRRFIQAGADVVIGHHPHVVQGVEVVRGRDGRRGVIFHSLGNFSFASRTNRHHKSGARLHSMMPLITVLGGKVHSVEIVPLDANNSEARTLDGVTLARGNFSPRRLRGKYAGFGKAVLEDIKRWTREIPALSPGQPRFEIVAETGKMAEWRARIRVAR